MKKKQGTRIFCKASKRHLVGKRPNGLSSQWKIRGENGNRPISVRERNCVRNCFAHISHYDYVSSNSISSACVLYSSNLPFSPQNRGGRRSGFIALGYTVYVLLCVFGVGIQALR
ncbi:hypothetical protein SDJN02_20297, partial [Cucurbita argyrosperma subsp. argyrosperma]